MWDVYWLLVIAINLRTTSDSMPDCGVGEAAFACKAFALKLNLRVQSATTGKIS